MEKSDQPPHIDDDLDPRDAAYTEAVENAIEYTLNKIREAVDQEITPAEAAQMGVDYISYRHQYNSLGLRALEKYAPESREKVGNLGSTYDLYLRQSGDTGPLIDSLGTQPDGQGIKDYLLGRAAGLKRAAEIDGEIDEETLKLSQGFAKISALLPTADITAQAPMIAWMDPRFNGEVDPSPTS